MSSVFCAPIRLSGSCRSVRLGLVVPRHSLTRSRRSLCVQAASKEKVLAILYEAKDGADNPQLLSCTENELGLRQFLEDAGHEYVVTADKDGEDSEMEKQLQDATIFISTPFHPGYLTRERLDKAPKLKLAITAGIGSDHVDLNAAADNGLTVAEATGSNNVSTAEQAVMQILVLVRNFVPAHEQIAAGGWDIGAVCKNAYDLESKCVGIVGAGRIGRLVMERLKAFNVGTIFYFDYNRLPEDTEKDYNCKYAEFDDIITKSDLISIHLPLSDKTEGMFGKDVLGRMKKGAWLVNVSRGAICDRDSIAQALEDGQLGGYAGDVWSPQPPPTDHPWRQMPYNAMTPHYAGNTIDAQKRYQKATKEMLQCWFDEKPFPEEYYIVREGKKADQYS